LMMHCCSCASTPSKTSLYLPLPTLRMTWGQAYAMCVVARVARCQRHLPLLCAHKHMDYQPRYLLPLLRHSEWNRVVAVKVFWPAGQLRYGTSLTGQPHRVIILIPIRELKPLVVTVRRRQLYTHISKDLEGREGRRYIAHWVCSPQATNLHTMQATVIIKLLYWHEGDQWLLRYLTHPGHRRAFFIRRRHGTALELLCTQAAALRLGRLGMRRRSREQWRARCGAPVVLTAAKQF
jgi:hypothetical protein